MVMTRNGKSVMPTIPIFRMFAGVSSYGATSNGLMALGRVVRRAEGPRDSVGGGRSIRRRGQRRKFGEMFPRPSLRDLFY